MLRRLTIRDFVLVERLELEFNAGFSVLSGETGAGKSILVDALAFALGERADVGSLRAGCERAEVSAEFDLSRSAAALACLRAQDIAVDDASLLLRRVLDANGRSRAYLNGSPATVQQVREVAESLLDIHGQHAHQSLLRGEAQRKLLDAHAGLSSLADDVAAAWRAWHEAKTQFDAAAGQAEALAREREELDWQVRELDALGFSADEWENLAIEHKRLGHAASLLDGARFALTALADEETACGALLEAATGRLDGLSAYDPALLEVAALLHSAQADLAEAVSALRRYADRVDLDPQRLEELERRTEAVLACARKYRVKPGELPALLARGRERQQELAETSDLPRLEARVTTARAHYVALAERLSKARGQAAAKLGAEVSALMQQLALSGGRFEIALLPLEGGAAHGLEQIEFRLSGVAGGTSRPLAKVASGGELSRISLAIQVVTSQAASVSTLIFDEVDVGIGGGVAEVVGRLLHELGRERQVLCVTHLPQVAAGADWQWQVSKSMRDGQAQSQVVLLDEKARVEEVARMLGGVEITAITRRHAREMLARRGDAERLE